MIWFAVRMWETTDLHSGYMLPLSPWNALLAIQGGTERHDFHHLKNIGAVVSISPHTIA